jgi:hypothetical protein
MSADPKVWFYITVPLRHDTLPSGVYSAASVAERTGRSYASVIRALHDGRIPRAAVAGTKRRVALVAATEADLEKWRLPPLSEALAARPDLPQGAGGWLTIHEIARRDQLTVEQARASLRMNDPPCLAWGRCTAFRGVRRYWVPNKAVI